jgi:hypothetical protein
LQKNVDDILGAGEFTVLDISETDAILASKDGKLFLQPWHRSSFSENETALHAQMKPIQEAKWKVKGTHPTKPGREITVRAKHARQAAAIGADEFAKSGHSVSSVQFVGDDTDPSGDQAQSPGSGN